MPAASTATFDPLMGDVAFRVELVVPDTGLMTADKFERVMTLMAGQHLRRGFSDRSIRAARLVLVMGASVAEAA